VLLTVRLALACVVLATVRLTVIPAPKFATVVPWAKCVLIPVRATVRVCPWAAVFGETLTDSPAEVDTTNPAVREAVSVVPEVSGVLTDTVREPGVAVELMARFTVNSVSDTTTVLETVMPAPKLTVGVPWVKCV
jgi:hypothetical protein